MAAHHQLTPEQEAYLAEHAPYEPRRATTEGFNARFGTSYAHSTIKAWCNARGLSNGNDGRFKSGNVSWQTGLHGEDYWAHFTPEGRAKSKKALDDSRQKYNEGDLVIRHGLPCVYKGKDSGDKHDNRIESASKSAWEAANGGLPDNMILIHLDGDVNNYTLENMKAIPRAWLADLRYTGGLTGSRETNETRLAYCALRAAIRERGKDEAKAKGGDAR